MIEINKESFKDKIKECLKFGAFLLIFMLSIILPIPFLVKLFGDYTYFLVIPLSFFYLWLLIEINFYTL